MSKEILKKLGIDLSDAPKETLGFLRGLIAEYQKNVKKFNEKSTQNYFNNFIAAMMLEYHKAYENFDIRVPYRIKSAKSAWDKILEYLTRDDKSIYETNNLQEPQGRLKEDLTDMFAITIVACNRPPTFYSDDPEINDLIEEKKKNHALLGVLQKYRLKITNYEFPGMEENSYSYNNNSNREEYYLNSIMLLNRIKTLIDPKSTKLLKRYDDMMDKIKANVPEKFFMAVDSMAKDPKITRRLTSSEQIKMAFELSQSMVENELTEEQLSEMKKPISQKDVEVVDYLEILEDFSARIQDKLDLAILKKQVYSVFANSEVLKKFGVSICHGSEKQKRTEAGYVSDFMYLQTPFGKVEMQLQTQHEHREGNYGYAAHNDLHGKSFKEFEIPHRSDREKIKEFRTCVEFVSPKKFLAQFDNAEPDRIVTQVFGKYQNYKSIMTQVKKGSEEDLRLKEYFKRIYTRRNELFAGEARQEMIESFIPFDIDIYLNSREFKKIMEEREEETK